MNKPNISASTAVPKLTKTLEDDIQFLNAMEEMKSTEKKMVNVIVSLRDAKKELLKALPDGPAGIDEAVTPPQKRILRNHQLPEKGVVDNNPQLITYFRDIEMSQMNFVKRALQADGMPKIISRKLHDVLEMYQSICDQLDRFAKTQQFDRIVL